MPILFLFVTWKAKNRKTNPKSLAVLSKVYLGDHYFIFHPHLLLLDTYDSKTSKQLSTELSLPLCGKAPAFEPEASKFTFHL